MKDNLPITRIFDLGDLSDAGYEADVVATDEEQSRIAKWEGVKDVESFRGHVTLSRRSTTRFTYRAHLEADILQDCVVTLERLRTRIDKSFSRDLHYSPAKVAERGGVVTLAAAEDETPEEIESLKFDLAGPLLEEFSLAIDPYPRAPGVEFEPPKEEPGAKESPFAVLRGLKQG